MTFVTFIMDKSVFSPPTFDRAIDLLCSNVNALVNLEIRCLRIIAQHRLKSQGEKKTDVMQMMSHCCGREKTKNKTRIGIELT